MHIPGIHIGFIVHGKPSRKKRFDKALMVHAGLMARFAYTVIYTKPGMVVENARNLADQSCTHIVAVGGDGTISEVVHGIMTSGNRQVIACLLPQGTANDWSKTWPVPAVLSDLLKAIKTGEYRTADLGCIEFADHRKRYFLNIADMGIGAEVIRRVNSRSKWLGPDVTFFLSILRTFFHYRNIEVTCNADGWTWTGKAKSIVAANGKYFGSGIGIAPEALPDDGLLDLVILGNVSLIDYLRYLPALRRTEKIRDPRVIYKRVSEIVLHAPEYAGIEADGEMAGSGSVRISVVPDAIRLLPPLQ